MDQVTINPIAQLLRNNPTKATFKFGDLAQVVEKLSKARDKKLKNPKQMHSVVVEQKYIEIIKRVLAELTPKSQITRTTLQARVDQLLRQENLYYVAQKAEKAHNNFFYRTTEPRTPKDRPYDLALYNLGTARAPGEEKFHHYNENTQPAVHYMRCEPRGREILFGNMQVDNSSPERWRDAGAAQILLTKKNIYASMVQEAIKHALDNNYRRIKFQCADAVTQAQEFHLQPVKITKKNLAYYRRRYHQALEEFEAAILGAPSKLLHPPNTRAVVFRKTPNEVRTEGYFRCAATGVFPNNYLLYTVVLSLYHNKNKNYFHELFLIKNALEQNKLRRVLQLVQKIFIATGVPSSELTARQVRPLTALAALTKNCSKAQPLTTKKFYTLIDKFLITQGYEKAYLRRYRNMTKITKTAPRSGENKFNYINTAKSVDRVIMRREFIIKPQIGKIYFQDRNLNFPFLYDLKKYNKANGLANSREGREIRAVSWYDEILPEVLKRFKLGYRRVRIKDPKGQPAHAWEIDRGLEEFAARPIMIFSSRANWQTDTVTLEQLTRAATKFGLTPEQLVSVNAGLPARGPRHPGAYNRQEDKIYLAPHSLALLAHEGLHRLQHQGLIPAREYAALVRAGQRLVASAPELREELERRDDHGKALYASAAERREEYAAVFTEHYYRTRPAARKALMGEKITKIERVWGYLQSAADILAARCGSAPARARSFLRRIEQNHYAHRQQEHPTGRVGNFTPEIALG